MPSGRQRQLPGFAPQVPCVPAPTCVEWVDQDYPNSPSRTIDAARARCLSRILRPYDGCFNDMSKCSSTRHLIAGPKIRESPTIEHKKKVAVLYCRQPMGDHDNCYMIT